MIRHSLLSLASILSLVLVGCTQTLGAPTTPAQAVKSVVFGATGGLITARQGHTATLLGTGKVLVAGGYNAGVYLSSAEIYDIATGEWSATGEMRSARSWHTATLLKDGRVLVAGGAERWRPPGQRRVV
jgi:hypothetical protein